MLQNIIHRIAILSLRQLQESLMSDNWFVKSNKNGKIFGPHPQELIRRYLKEGKINHREYTISSDGNTWQSLSSFWRQKGPAAEIMGKYEILEELGRGGMGIVYKAFDTQLKRHCAIKVLVPIGNIDKKRAIERFKTEAMAIAKITHPNIVQVYEVHDQHPYFFVMNYIEGLPLDTYIEDLDLPQRLQMFSKICTPIIFAHQNNILHRDLKPDNIIVTVSGEPIIVDFGIAKNTEHKTNVTQTGDIVGTPRYISPEAVNGQQVDERSDVYSLGVILYEMLTDRVPFVGGSPVEIMVRLTSEDPVAPSLLNTSVKKNGDLELVCLAALEKKPPKRIPSVVYLKSEIDNIINGHPIKLKPPKMLQRFTKWRKKNPVVFATVTAMFIIVCAALFAMKLEREHSFHLQQKTQQHILQLQKKSMQEITETKVSSIDSTIEALSTNIAANNIFVDYYAIKRCYRYLSEIIDNLPPERAKKIYQTLNMYLKFHILCKFPHVFEATLPPSDHIAVFSSRFIARLYNEKQSQTLYIWEKNQQQKFSQDNYYAKIPNIYNENMLKFSSDNRYLAYQNHGHTNIFDLQTKKIIFSQLGFTGNAIFSPQNNYYLFLRQQEKVKTCHLLNLSNFQMHNFQTYDPKDMVISPNEEWLVIHDKARRKFVIYNFKKDQVFEFQNDMLSNDNRICFTKNENKIFMVSRVNITILNLSQLANEKTSPSLLMSTRLSSPPIRINDYYFTIATKDGSIVLAKQNIDDDSVFQEKLANYSNVGISHIAFQAPSFLTIARNNTLELRDLSTKKLISILREKTAVKQLQLQEKNGLQISLVTQQNYKEYTFPYTTLRIQNEGVKKLVATFMSMIRDIDPAHSLIVDKDTCIYTGRVGFGVWRDGRFFDKRFYEEIISVKYNKSRKQLFLCGHKKMYIFSGKDASWVDNYDIPRTFFKRGISYFDFSHDEQHLYLACNKPYELLQQDIRTKKLQKIAQTQTPIKRILPLKGDMILLGCTAFVTDRSEIHVVNKKSQTQQQILKDTPLFGITSFATDKTQQLFAAGGQNGNILLWKGLSSPVLYDKLKIDNQVAKLMFSPQNKYLAIFSLNRTYIYNLELKTKLEIYSGYYKGKSATFSEDWKKMYTPSAVGEVMVFNQDYLINEAALRQRIRQCDKTMSADNTATLMHYINNISKKIK